MKRILLLLLALSLFLTLCSCSKTLRGTDALIEKAREEIPLADAENIEIRYAGLTAKDDLALIWFISGNEYQAHSYLPMECKIVGKDEYRFVRTYKPMGREEDIAVLQWGGGYVFLINNPACAALQITDSVGMHDIAVEKESYPFIYFHERMPSEYLFLDKDGTEL